MPEVKIRALYIFECEFLTRPKCDALRDFVPFVQFKQRVKHPWSSVNFSKVAGFRLQRY